MEKELFGKKFKVVKNGLDEREVSAFITGLIEPNEKLTRKIENVNNVLNSLSERHDYLVSRLTSPESSSTSDGVDASKLEQLNSAINSIVGKLDNLSTTLKTQAPSQKIVSSDGIEVDAAKVAHLDSLTKLAESTIIEADKHAERIRTEIVGKAQAEAQNIILQAKQMVQGEIQNMFDQAYQKIASNMDLSGVNTTESTSEYSPPSEPISTVYSGHDQTESINQTENDTSADSSTYKIVEDVLGEYKDEEQEQPSDNKLDDSEQENAVQEPEEPSDSKEEDQEPEGSVQEYDDSQEDQEQEEEEESKAEDTTNEQDTEEESEESSDDQDKEDNDEESDSEESTNEQEESATAEDEATTNDEHDEENPSEQEGESEQPEIIQPDDPELYLGTIELVIPPPVGLDRVMQLHKDLKHIDNVEVLNFGGSVDKGITIKMIANAPTRFLDIIGEMDGVESIVDESEVSEDILPPRPTGDGSPLRRIVLFAEHEELEEGGEGGEEEVEAEADD